MAELFLIVSERWRLCSITKGENAGRGKKKKTGGQSLKEEAYFQGTEDEWLRGTSTWRGKGGNPLSKRREGRGPQRIGGEAKTQGRPEKNRWTTCADGR